MLTVATDASHFIEGFTHSNYFLNLQRVVGWMLRFVGGRSVIDHRELTVRELSDASDNIAAQASINKAVGGTLSQGQLSCWYTSIIGSGAPKVLDS